MEFEAAKTNLEAAVQRKEAFLNCKLPCQVDNYKKKLFRHDTAAADSTRVKISTEHSSKHECTSQRSETACSVTVSRDNTNNVMMLGLLTIPRCTFQRRRRARRR